VPIEMRRVEINWVSGEEGLMERPHLPPSPRRSAGTRLSAWQCGQGMVTVLAMVKA
jgi:hypothetical protein